MMDYKEFKTHLDNYFNSLSGEELVDFVHEICAYEDYGISVDEYLAFYENDTQPFSQEIIDFSGLIVPDYSDYIAPECQKTEYASAKAYEAYVNSDGFDPNDFSNAA